MFLRVAVCVLLSALVVHGDVQPHTISRALLPRVYGVKLCGREFIRAVIFTCGGSRWKRFIDADYGERTFCFSCEINWNLASNSKLQFVLIFFSIEKR
uniref:Insulin-like domain-containing protein n=1 Tax=Hippocampus comes TaxID=109280 RepID=A0A3Q2XS32_HIPCM